MAYIYEISNDINNKVYIGKTEFSIERRFKEHCKEAFRIRCEKRPLYRAMRKYGCEHFLVSLLEETNQPEEREVYWINKKQSYHKGYNATYGGDGKKYLDYNLVMDTYLRLKSVKDTAEKLNICPQTVSKILNINNIEIKSSSEVIQNKHGKAVNQYTLEGDFIQTFPSAIAAAASLGKVVNRTVARGAGSHIAAVCKGNRKTAYGYIWKYNT